MHTFIGGDMRAYRIAALLTLVLTTRAAAQSASTSAAATITPQDVKTHIDFLASDQLKGRDTPSPGLEMAADYIAKQFAAFGLKPAATMARTCSVGHTGQLRSTSPVW